MEHTAGPWKIKWKDNVVSENERLICNCAGHQCNIYSYEIDKENEANARLIAAAPDLLEACKAAKEEIEILWKETGRNPTSPASSPWDYAISKAEGK